MKNPYLNKKLSFMNVQYDIVMTPMVFYKGEMRQHLSVYLEGKNKLGIKGKLIDIKK